MEENSCLHLVLLASQTELMTVLNQSDQHTRLKDIRLLRYKTQKSLINDFSVNLSINESMHCPSDHPEALAARSSRRPSEPGSCSTIGLCRAFVGACDSNGASVSWTGEGGGGGGVRVRVSLGGKYRGTVIFD